MANHFDTIREALKNGIRIRNHEGGTKYQPELEAQALTALAQIEANHAHDLATAAAQGFRDGVASVAGQEPVAFLDRAQLEELRHANGMDVWAEGPNMYEPACDCPVPLKYVPVYTAPVAQQPHAVAVPPGYALVPKRMTKAMEYVTEQEDWTWEDLLAAAPVAQPPHAEHDLNDVRCECCGYMTHHREHMGCIRAASKQPQAKAVPPGYVLVSVEPTKEMLYPVPEDPPGSPLGDLTAQYRKELWAEMLEAQRAKT